MCVLLHSLTLFLSANMRFSESVYQKFKSIIHPKLKANIHKFKKDGYYSLPTYHGCGKKRNRNGTNKKVNYRNGDWYSMGTHNQNWEDWYEIDYYLLPCKMYFARFTPEIGLNKLAKHKGYMWYDWDKKMYIDNREWYKPQKQEFVAQKNKPIGEMIKNEVI